MGEGSADGVGAVPARAVVLATGGMGQVFAATTNPAVSTGDGVALALRAGAVVARPGVRPVPPDRALARRAAARGQQPLVTEAVRGEGAVLVDDAGTRFMQGVHELADLAPRDVVAKAIMRRMRETGRRPRLARRPRTSARRSWRGRFPTILAPLPRARHRPGHRADPGRARPPTTPAAGSAPTCDGRTSVPGLYACGEVACTGVHGANRLASNSLLEGLVFAGGSAPDLARGRCRRGPSRSPSGARRRGAGSTRPTRGHVAGPTMSDGAGVLRTRRRAWPRRPRRCAARWPARSVDDPGAPRPGRRPTCSRSRASLVAAARRARRPAAATGARTSRTATTRAGTGHLRRGPGHRRACSPETTYQPRPSR